MAGAPAYLPPRGRSLALLRALARLAGRASRLSLIDRASTRGFCQAGVCYDKRRMSYYVHHYDTHLQKNPLRSPPVAARMNLGFFGRKFMTNRPASVVACVVSALIGASTAAMAGP